MLDTSSPAAADSSLASAIAKPLGHTPESSQSPAVLLPSSDDKPSSRQSVPDLKTMTEWIKQAQKGSANAQYNLGVAYWKGQGIVQDYTEAVELFHKAVKQGNASAQYNLGIACWEGQGIARDYTEAVKWFRKAAEQGDAPAQHNLGLACRQGRGTAQNHTEAVKWFRNAAEQGVARAQYNLGIACRQGEGVAQDYTEAVKWLRKAAEQGDTDAQHSLGFIYYAQQNYTEAREWFAKAAEQERGSSQLYLSLFYRHAYAVKQNKSAALSWLHKAAANWLATNDARLETGDRELIDFLHQQADESIKPAQVILYFIYRDGNGVAQNAQTALHRLKQAASRGDPLGRYALGLAYLEGKILPADAGKAREQFNKIKHALEEKDKILSHFSEAGLHQHTGNPESAEKDAYSRDVKQWLAFLAQTKLNELETQERLKKSKQELEDMQGMLVHKFRGTLRTIRYNLEYNQPAWLSLVQTDTMIGLLEIFGLISHDAERLRERLRQDNRGDNRGTGTLNEVLKKALSFALKQLLTIERMDDIIQHYLAYAVRAGDLPAGTKYKELRYNDACREIWQNLQTTWERQWHERCQSPDLDISHAWVAERFFPLQVEGFCESSLQFSAYGVKDSLFLVIVTELLVNVFKYYSSPAGKPVRLCWSKTQDGYVLSIDNPANDKERLKGSTKGHKFLKVIADKLNGQFQAAAEENHYSVKFTLPADLFN
ncbi:MAG: tetratricopeptide repeat protein [Gammaproteobacteria bacterium]|nr:tetratricopeptide repeat protein [Gammaproteobacteria bacterium]